LSTALTRFLISLGHDAEHVADIELASAPDSVIWRYAIDVGAVIITKDEDFLTLRTLHPDGPAIVWVRIGNTTRDTLLRTMQLAMPTIIAALQAGETVVEVTG